MTKRLIALLITVLMPMAAMATQAPLSVEQVKQRLSLNVKQFASGDSVSGSFIQKKYFKVLKLPFKSNGEFTFSEQEFVWQTLVPVNSAIIFSDNKLQQQNAQGQVTELPNIDGLARLLPDLLQARFDNLAMRFSFAEHNKANCVSLTPEDQNLKQAISNMSLCADNNGQVSNIELLDQNNNKTEIALSYH
ncbi:MAG: LolA family protein [Cognaticolwellia aestuarii]